MCAKSRQIMAKLTVCILGGFSVRAAGKPLIFPTKKSRGLLAYLALGHGQVYAREHLASLLWGDSSDEEARHSLRQALSHLRKALPRARPEILRSDPDGVVLNPTTLDVAAFERFVAEGTPQALARAVELYRGALLEGLSFKEEPWEEWLRAERERLQELAVGALKKLLARHTETGAGEAAIQIARRLLMLDPHDEAVHRSLMRLYLGQGRRASALQQYQVCLQTLQRELGVEPEAETRLLYQELLPQRVQSPQTPEGAAPRRGRRPQRAPRPPHASRSNPAAPLVGRASELDRLNRAMESAWAGRGPLVAILGEAGIGKTRLLDELIEIALRRGAQVVPGRCYETEQIFPFGPWVNILRTAIKGRDLDGLSPLWRAELSRLLPELGEPGVHPPVSAGDQLRLFDTVMGFVRHIAIQQPLVVLLDDLHWADEMSLRLLSFLVRRSQGAPILIVGTARDDELESAPLLRRIFDDFDRDDRVVRLILSPLDQAQTLELVRALAVSPRGATLPAALGDHVWAASEGHPFMIVETLREIWEGQTPLTAGTLPMPQRVRRLVLSRLYRLSDQSKRLASVAAVEELVRRRVLNGAGELFDFVHDRVREVTYDNLNVPERRLLHGQVARALEEIHGSDLEPCVDALGTHYREAEVWEKAHLYLRRAGLNAFWRVANREAVAFFEQALAAVRCLPRSEQTLGATIDVLMDLGGSLSRLDEVHRALDFLRQADVLARESNDQRRMGYVACHLSEFLRPLGAFDEAIEAGTRALTIGSSLGDFTLEVLSTTSLGKAHLESGEFRKTREFFVRAISKLSEDGHPARAAERSPVEALLVSSVQYSRKWNLGIARYFLAHCLSALGEFSEAIANGRASLQAIESTDHPDAFSVILACLAAGMPSYYKGDLLDAIPLLERALLTAQTSDVKAFIPLSASPLGLAYVLSGRTSEGLSLLEDTVERLESQQITLYLLTLIYLGQGYLQVGRLDEALSVASRAVGAAHTWKARSCEAGALRLLGDIASHRDPLDVGTAECHFRDALNLADQLGLRPTAAHCHLDRGRLYSRIGRLDEARNEIGTAIELFREMQMGSWMIQAESALAET